MAESSKVDFREAIRAMEALRTCIAAGHIISDEARMLREQIDGCRTEQEVTPFLQQHPWVIGKLADARYPHVFKQFPIGTRFPDFVVLDSFSGGWDVTMIELEPPSAPLFTKSGNPAHRLAGAIKQVDDWRRYVAISRQEVLLRLSEHYREKDMTYGVKSGDATDCSGIALADARSVVCWHYMVVIGRRRQLTPDTIAKKAAFRDLHGINIATYDRLIELLDRMKVLPF